VSTAQGWRSSSPTPSPEIPSWSGGSNVNGFCLQQHIYEDDVSGSPHMDSWTALEQTSSIYQACGNGFGEMQFWDRQDLWQWNGSQWADVNAGPWVPNNGSWQADTGYNFPSPPGGASYFGASELSGV